MPACMPDCCSPFLEHKGLTEPHAPCCRFLLSQHPEVEAKVVQELQSLGLAASPKNPHPRELTYADLAELVYLQAVVKVPINTLWLPSHCLKAC